MNRLFIDAGPFIGACNSHDGLHRASVNGFGLVGRVRLVTTSLVVAEAAARLRYDAGHGQTMHLRAFMQGWPTLEVVHPDDVVMQAAWELLERYDDLKLSLCDAVSAIVAQREGCDAIFSFDRDFLVLGFGLYPGNVVGEDAAPYVAMPVAGAVTY